MSIKKDFELKGEKVVTFMDALDALDKVREKVQAVINTRDIRHLINIEVSYEVIEKALQLAAPIQQPKARGVDEVAGIMYANSTDEGDYGKWIEAKDYHKVAALILVHLQQSPQGIDADNYKRERDKAVEYLRAVLRQARQLWAERDPRVSVTPNDEIETFLASVKVDDHE